MNIGQIILVLTIILVIIKLVGAITWPWYIIFTPLITVIISFFILFVLSVGFISPNYKKKRLYDVMGAILACQAGSEGSKLSRAAIVKCKALFGALAPLKQFDD